MFRWNLISTAAMIAAVTCTFAEPTSAATTLSVNLGDSIRPVTHVASGSLYGLTETYPEDIEANVAPLKPNVFLAPARSGSGHQQPIGGAFLVSPRIANTTGKVQIRLADIFSGWPYAFVSLDDWKQKVTEVVNDKKAASVQNFDGYEIWNEPNGTWSSTTIDFNSGLWKETYDLLRTLDPDAKIVGPSYSWYSSTRMEEFVKYCSQNNCMPDVISWHQWGSEGLVGAIENYRSLEQKYGVTARAISINEYSSDTHTLEGCPGVSVPFISKFERHGVESAMISWWFTNLPGRLGSLLTAKNERGGGWWLYKWYGDMAGYMASVTPPNDKSDGVDGFAAVDRKKNTASIIVGGNTLGEISVEIKGIPEFMGNKVQAILEYVTWVDKDSAVTSTTPISTTAYEVMNGSITIPINIENVYYAYHIQLDPIIPQSPFNGKAATIPGTIQAEDFDNGSAGDAYSDNESDNRGGAYRENGVDIVGINCADSCNGYAVGYTVAGEWMEYTVNVSKDSEYKISANVATASKTSGFMLYMDDQAITDSITIPQTDTTTWDIYKETDIATAALIAGEHVLKLLITGSYVNIDNIKFIDVNASDPPEAIKAATPTKQPATLQRVLRKGGKIYIQRGDRVFDLMGNQVK